MRKEFNRLFWLNKLLPELLHRHRYLSQGMALNTRSLRDFRNAFCRRMST